MGEVFSAVSGFSGPIVPSSSVKYVFKVLEQKNPSLSQDSLRSIWAKMDASHLAKI